ncbi:MAG: hypothetical protein IH605_19630 [Burkholderiales bacterium]|nr:hypothetical protein [Burkholderiales bacterium]
MNANDTELVIATYKDAIDKLEKYQASEPDAGKRQQASQKITDYRQKIIDAAWLGIVTRTDALNELAQQLNGIIANASKVPTMSGKIADLQTVVAQAAAQAGTV